MRAARHEEMQRGTEVVRGSVTIEPRVVTGGDNRRKPEGESKSRL